MSQEKTITWDDFVRVCTDFREVINRIAWTFRDATVEVSKGILLIEIAIQKQRCVRRAIRRLK